MTADRGWCETRDAPSPCVEFVRFQSRVETILEGYTSQVADIKALLLEQAADREKLASMARDLHDSLDEVEAQAKRIEALEQTTREWRNKALGAVAVAQFIFAGLVWLFMKGQAIVDWITSRPTP